MFAYSDNSEYITKGSIVEQENNSAVILITCSANSTIDTKQILLQATLSFNAEQELDGILWTSLNTNSVLPFTFPVSTGEFNWNFKNHKQLFIPS